MWRLQNIYAKNLCSFKELDYDVPQSCTTLVFGNNMDNDSQGSNGSGKSTMLEAVAIGLTGESLRKVKSEEIINDAEDTAVVRLTLNNIASLSTMVINRTFPRKGSQTINVKVTNKDNVTEDVVCSSIADYNKYILEAIGLTKEEVFSTFVLSKHKYNSFLLASDKEKKELINRFSNGNMVDESISFLHEDIESVEHDLRAKDIDIANVLGKINAYEEQINEATQDLDKKKAQKEKVISEHKESIIKERSLIRDIKCRITESKDLIKMIDEADEMLQKIEHSEDSVETCFESIKSIFQKHKLDSSSIVFDIDDVKNKLVDETRKYEKFSSELEKYELEVEEQKAKYNKANKEHEQHKKSSNKELESLNKERDGVYRLIEKIESDIRKLKRDKQDTISKISSLHTMIAGLIVCPKCKHEFVLDATVDVQDTKIKISEFQKGVEDLNKKIDDKNIELERSNNDEERVNNELSNLKKEIAKAEQVVSEECMILNSMNTKLSFIKTEMHNIQCKIKVLQNDISRSRINLFDEAYAIIDRSVREQENALEYAKNIIEVKENLIQSYESSIEELNNMNEDDSISVLQNKLKTFNDKLASETEMKNKIKSKLDMLKIQESTFIDFKTHLANTKIEALSNITNEFLKEIGSDLRIVFSGFTVLKSGKIRDKISISLVRDGVDCGSFDKHSEGEKARVNIASILAMHKLTNMNCDNEKGLDLLVLDEILEATDEQGLSNIFNALNNLKITSLIVSHGQLAENYPHKVVINKKNNVSYIND